MKKEKRLLAFLLSLVLCIGMLPTSAFAADFSSGAGGDQAIFSDGSNSVNQPAQTAASAEIETPAEETVITEEETPEMEDITVDVEESGEEDPVSDVETPEAEEPVSGDASADFSSGAENSADTAEIISGENNELTMPAQDFSGEINGIGVTVNAPEGAFPKDTVMSVSEADENAVKAAAEAADTGLENVKAVDITFTAQGEKVQPAKAVKVTLKTDLIAAAEAPVVLHVGDDAKAEVIEETLVEADTVSFEADAFSVYAVAAAEENEPEVQAVNDLEDENTNCIVSIEYVFENNNTAAQTWSASLGKGTPYSNTVAYPDVIGYEPEILQPLPEGVATVDNGITFNLTNIQNNIEIKVIYKPAVVTYTVKYYQQNVNDDGYTLAETVTERGRTGSPIGVTYDSVKNKYTGFYGLRFDESATIAADGSTEVEIYYDRSYYLMRFDLDGGYGVEPIYARYGAPISVGTPEKSGHTFSGWDQQIPSTMPAANTTIKALWNVKTVNYTVVFWYENADDDGYSYAGSYESTALVGTEIASGNFSDTDFEGRDRTHFTYNNQKTETATVSGDGSTVLNVYFTRNIYTLTFREKSGGWWGGSYETVATITAKYNAEISGEFNKAPFNTTYNGRAWEDTGNTYDYALQTLDRMPGTNVTFNLYNQSSKTKKTIYYYVQTVDSTANLTSWPNNNRPTSDYELMKTVDTYFNYATYDEEYHEIQGFTRFDRRTAGFNNDNQKDFSKNELYLYYIRNSYKLRFYNYNGYVENHEVSVKYQANLGKYNFTPDYPSTLEKDAYKFAGWYLNPQCTGEKVELSTATMPFSDLTLYAKWEPVTHTVNTYSDSTLGNLLDMQTVSHGSFANEPEEPENGNYTFVGWFHLDNEVEKAFAFDSMPVRKDLNIYAKWSSNVLVEYTIKYESVDGVEIAAPTTGSALAGTTKTFEAKTGDQLNAGYQTGYFPTVSSHSLTMDIDGGEKNVYTFVYKPAEKVPYTVKYLDKETGDVLAEAKVVSDNTHAVVTETAETIPGYLPDAFQKRLILTVPEDGNPTAEDNVLIFYYTEDSVHAIVSTTHYLMNGEVVTQYQHSEETGTIGQTYTRKPLNIDGYMLDRVTINGKEWEEESDPSAVLEGEGLHFVFYYKPDSFYVYHSSDQSVQSIKMLDIDETFDITSVVKEGYLYGGYYSSYGGVGSYTGGPTATVDGTAYTGAQQEFWDADAVYKTKGTSMKPENGVTYYLKEVPKTYLNTRHIETYNRYTLQLRTMVLTTVVDDVNYQTVGFRFNETDYNKTVSVQSLYDSLTFELAEREAEPTTQTFKAKDLSDNEAGKIAAYTYFNYKDEANIDENDQIIYTSILGINRIRAYWVTPDGVTVVGGYQRMLNIKDKDGDGAIRVDGTVDGVEIKNKEIIYVDSKPNIEIKVR